jgi:hypothetical protein
MSPRMIDPATLRVDAVVSTCERRWFAAAGLPIKASYRVDEVVRLLDVTPRQVHKMLADGRLPRLEIPPSGKARPAVVPTRIPYAVLAALLPEDLRE